MPGKTWAYEMNLFEAIDKDNEWMKSEPVSEPPSNGGYEEGRRS